MDPSASDRRQIGVFAKFWQPGRVKTRLASTIGDEAAAELARTFLWTLTQRLESRPESKVIGFAPAAAAAEQAFAALAPTWTLQPQCQGDLGARMTQYFDASFHSGATHVLLLGADCPALPLSRIDDAFDALADQDVVLGPAHDGGYYLIAARRRTPPLFDHGQWGDAGVLERTVALAHNRDVSVAMLEPWDDVDEMDDLKQLAERLQLATFQSSIWSPLRSAVAAAMNAAKTRSVQQPSSKEQ